MDGYTQYVKIAL